jgi:hypothetical protein
MPESVQPAPETDEKKSRGLGRPRALKFHPGLLVAFLIPGAVLCFGLAILAGYANAIGGMGDGSSSSPYNDSNIIAIPFAIYFACGVIASLIPDRPTRIVLAFVAHIAPLLAVLGGGSANMLFLAILALIVYGVFSMAWIRMLKRSAP